MNAQPIDDPWPAPSRRVSSPSASGSRRTFGATITVAKSAPRSRSFTASDASSSCGPDTWMPAARSRGARTRCSTSTRRPRASSRVCVAMLVDRGVLSYDDTVASVWPEFAQNGKQHITIAQVLSHQAGLPAFEDPTTLEDLYDWHARCAALAGQKPRWMPGEKTAYHPITYGYLAGEIVRRASGRSSLGEFLQKELATPLEADFFIGLEPALHRRVAETLAPKNLIDPSALPSHRGNAPAASRTRCCIRRRQTLPHGAGPRCRRSTDMLRQTASRGSTRCSPMAVVFQRRRFLSPATIDRMTQVLSNRMDLMLGMEAGWAAGVVSNGTTQFLRPEPADLWPFRLGRLVRLRRSGQAARDRLRLQPDGTGSRGRRPRARAVRGDL